MKRIPQITAGLLLLPAIAFSQQGDQTKKQMHKEVKMIVITDDESGKKEDQQVKVMVMQDTLIHINTEHNGRVESSVKVNVTDENGMMVIRVDENGKEPQVIRLDLGKLSREMEQMSKEMGNLKEEEIERMVEKYIPKLENMEQFTIALDKQLEGMEIEMEKLEDHLKEIHIDGINGQVDTIINETRVSDDGKTVTHTLIVRASVNVDEFSDMELNDLREKNNDKSATTLKVDKLEFYPNPSDGRFTVNFVTPQKGDLQITVTDMNGKQVYQERVPDFQGSYNKQFDLSMMTGGIYVLRMAIGNQSHYKKLIID